MNLLAKISSRFFFSNPLAQTIFLRQTVSPLALLNDLFLIFIRITGEIENNHSGNNNVRPTIHNNLPQVNVYDQFFQ